MRLRPQSAKNAKQIADNLLSFVRESFDPRDIDADTVSPYHTTISRAGYCKLPKRRRSDRLSQIPASRVRRLRRLQCMKVGGTWMRSLAYDTKHTIPRTHHIELLKHRCVVCDESFDNDFRVPWTCGCKHYMCAVCYDRKMREALSDDVPFFPCPVCEKEDACEYPLKVIAKETEQQLYDSLMKGLTQMTKNDPTDPEFKTDIKEAEKLAQMLTDNAWIAAANEKIQICINMLEFHPGEQGYLDSEERFNAMK